MCFLVLVNCCYYAPVSFVLQSKLLKVTIRIQTPVNTTEIMKTICKLHSSKYYDSGGNKLYFFVRNLIL